MREIERDIEATKINKKREKEKKKERRVHTTIPFERSTLVLHLLSLVLHRDYHHAYSYVGNFYTIELGLYIPMMSFLKRALGLLEKQVRCTATSSIGEILAHTCIRCMAIPTPHIISIIWPSLAYDCPH